MNVTTPIKPRRRDRRTKAEVQALRDAIIQTVETDQPVTVRQVFYRLVSVGLVEKNEREYQGTVSRLLGEMRVSGEIPWEWVADNTRWMRKPETYPNLNTMLKAAGRTYRRAVWDTQSVYVEIWLEKEALAGVLYPVTSQWDVPLMVTKGYASLSFLYEAAQAISAQGKPAYLYYLGDYDPSGLDIPAP